MVVFERPGILRTPIFPFQLPNNTYLEFPIVSRTIYFSTLRPSQWCTSRNGGGWQELNVAPSTTFREMRKLLK